MRMKQPSHFLSRIIIVSFFFLIPLQSQADQQKDGQGADPVLLAIMAGEHRSDENKARDPSRHPAETLTWFGLEKNMTVVEIWPGSGWYTDILAPYLKDSGRYYAAGPDANSDIPFVQNLSRQLKDKLASDLDLYGKAIISELSPPHKTAIAPESSVDMVLTFCNVHNWLSARFAPDVFAAMYTALKPGGILGLIEHRGDASARQDPRAQSGYVTEAATIQLAEAAGFTLAGRSEINANPNDVKYYPGGVWTLPPTLALGDKSRAAYVAIGESDRMTLKFVKPDKQ